MVLFNLFICVLCGVVAKQAFELGLNTNGWWCLVLSAINAAYYLNAII